MAASAQQIEAKEANWRTIEERWANGDTMNVISKHLGWTVDHLSVEMRRIRVAGRALPHRKGYPRPPAAHKHGRPRGR